MDDLDGQLQFGRMALALGLLDGDQLCRALVRLGGAGDGADLPGLLLEEGVLNRDQVALVEANLSGALPGSLVAGETYELGREIGRGAFGRVIRARDRRLGRSVAIKTLLPQFVDNPEAIGRFLLEAQIAGQLTHPNTIPVHELGCLPGGGLFYAMMEVQGETLADAVAHLRRGEPEERYPLPRLVGHLRQACQAVGYAHAQGVIHRDLKPHNVMVGPFGEVFVLDWGSAKLISDDPTESMEIHVDADMLGETASSVMTRAGQLKGTPAYMAPEQARADAASVGKHTDVYALGAVLYEILCLEPPFGGGDVDRVLRRVVSDPPLPPRSRAPWRSIPAELEEVALRCLAKDPLERPASVRALIAVLDEYLEGTRRREEAQMALGDAETALERYEDLVVETARLQRDVTMARRGVAPWAAVEDKRPLWALERSQRDRTRQREEAFNLALASFQRALGYDPDSTVARQGLADLYWRKFEEAESRGDEEATEFFRTQVLLHDDGTYRREFGGMATVRVESDPPGARAVLFRFEEQDHALVPSLPRELGRTPTPQVRVAQGSYLLRLRLEGHAEARLALFSSRPGTRRYHVRLRRHDEIGEGFVFVPGGRFLCGGDPHVPESWPRRAVHVPDMAIARRPVTLGEYLEFLDDLAAREGKDALARAPRADAHGRRLVRWDGERGRMRLVERAEYGADCRRWPVFAVAYADALEYARWRAERTGLPLRLPTEMEWEKAARGVDGRLYPWGDHFESTYCNCRSAREDRVRIEPVGSYPRDVSPYGVQDLAGGVMEWCAAEGDPDPVVVRVRGGAWNREGRDCSLVEGRAMPPWTTGPAIGFRLAMSLLGSGGFA